MGSIRNKNVNKLKRISQAILIVIGAFITAYGLEAVLIHNNV